jgi:inorganic pyrophosphatase
VLSSRTHLSWSTRADGGAACDTLLGTPFGGDNDPVDVVELGGQLEFGAVAVVKVLGALGLIDDGEIDWKLFTIADTDPLFPLLNGITLTASEEWK